MDSVKNFFDVWINITSHSEKKTEKEIDIDEDKKQNTKDIPFTPAQWYAYYFTPWIDNKQTIHYLKEIWKPIDKIANSNAVGIESITKILNTDKYQQLINEMFSFGLLYDELKNKNKNTTESYWKYLLEQGWQSLSFFSKNLQNLFFKSNKNSIDNLLPFQEFIQNYTNKILDLQYFFFQIGIKSIEKTAEKVLKDTIDNKVKFEDFYQIWLETIKKDMQNFLLGENFNQIWSEILQLADKISYQTNSTIIDNET